MAISGSYAQSSNIEKWTGTKELAPISSHQLIAHGSHLYMLGGEPAFKKQWELVAASKILPEGGLTDWDKKTPQLPYKADQAASTLYKNYIYYLGGWSDAEGAFNRIVYAEIFPEKTPPGATLGPWKDIMSLPQKVAGHTAVVVGDRLYVLGGRVVLEDKSDRILQEVFSAEILTDGSLKGWGKLGLPLPLYGHATVVYNRGIYVIGGSPDGSKPIDGVFAGEILSNGDIKGWQKLEQLPKPLMFGRATVIEGYIFYLGGYDGSNFYDKVWRTKILPDGSLDKWVEQASLPLDLADHGFASYGGRAYVVGGRNGGGFLSKVFYSDPPITGGVSTGTTTVTQTSTVTMTETKTSLTTSTVTTLQTITLERVTTVLSPTTTTLTRTDVLERLTTVIQTQTQTQSIITTIISPTTLVSPTTLTRTITETSPSTLTLTTVMVSPTTLTQTETLREKVREGQLFRPEEALTIATAMVLVSIGVSVAIARLGKKK